MIQRPNDASADDILHETVYIEWIDSSSYNGWRDQDEVDALTPYFCRTFALLIRETPHHVIIAHSETYGNDETFKKMYLGTLSIPKKAIIRQLVFPEGSL